VPPQNHDESPSNSLAVVDAALELRSILASIYAALRPYPEALAAAKRSLPQFLGPESAEDLSTVPDASGANDD